MGCPRILTIKIPSRLKRISRACSIQNKYVRFYFLMEVTKAIIPIAGLATRFLPVSKVVPKELLPLVDKPLLQYAVEEAKESGIQEIVFVVNSNKKSVSDYFRKSPKLEKLLEERKQEKLLEELIHIEKLLDGLTFSYVLDKPLGDGHAILQAKKYIGDEACAVMFPDDVILSKTPCVKQLVQIFRTALKPIISLYQIPQEKLSLYGVVDMEKIARRFSKIKKIVEKPALGSAPSNLVVVGRYIIIPEVFDYLKKTKPTKRGEIILADAFADMLQDGKLIYGYEIEGEWMECGDKMRWLRSNVALSLKHPVFGKEIREFLKEQKLI